MKATELRIGNWVMYSSKIQVNENKIRECVDHPDRFVPMRITEEWLTRFGFEKTYSELSYCEYDLGKIGVEINSDKLTVSYNYGTDVEWVNFTHIKYVHQLQNLYHALTGEELTIKE